jgi:hypothetical protein
VKQVHRVQQGEVDGADCSYWPRYGGLKRPKVLFAVDTGRGRGYSKGKSRLDDWIRIEAVGLKQGRLPLFSPERFLCSRIIALSLALLSASVALNLVLSRVVIATAIPTLTTFLNIPGLFYFILKDNIFIGYLLSSPFSSTPSSYKSLRNRPSTPPCLSSFSPTHSSNVDSE